MGRSEQLAHAQDQATRAKFNRRLLGGAQGAVAFGNGHGVTQRGNFVVLLSTGEIPRLYGRCLVDLAICGAADFTTIPDFGSSYVDKTLLPTSVAMQTTVQPQTLCFDM